MKNIIIVFISIVILSCDPSYITTFYLRNNTNDSLKVEFFRNDSADNEKTIPSFSSITILHVSEGISGSPAKISFESDDSIRVTKRDRFIMFYRDSTSKSEIYNMENWVEKKVVKHNYKYTYTFNEEDFN